ncbi:hypothetical protein MNBD_ALPHA12-2042 [hydrothermal vent metagenome]|uniref:Organic solvent tolerance-like N-terminal domain-containing protein n=1 Tax=hydrothermal vent metagenome TaxID=652676 RepID=A0A3B0TKU1_9ZZZZ
MERKYWAKRLTLVLCAFVWLGAFSALTQAQTSQRVQIVADRFVVRESENRSEFVGNVIVTQPGLKIWADKVIVYYGPKGTSDIKSFEALGNVRIENDGQTATGDRGVYDPKTRIMRLSGNVMLVNASSSVSASELRIDLNSNITEFSTPGDGGRVTGVFTPDN